MTYFTRFFKPLFDKAADQGADTGADLDAAEATAAIVDEFADEFDHDFDADETDDDSFEKDLEDEIFGEVDDAFGLKDGEQEQPEGEQEDQPDAEAEEPADEEEPEDDQDADEPDAELEEGDEAEEEPEEPQPDPALVQTVSDLTAKIREKIPGAVIESPEDLPSYVGAIAEANAEMRAEQDALADVFTASPQALNLVKALRGGKTLTEAIAEALVDEAGEPLVQLSEPDKFEDPDAYAAFQLQKQQREQARKEAEARTAKEREAIRDYQRLSEADAAEFAREHFADEEGNIDEAASRAFFARVGAQFNGDPDTGKMPRPKATFELLRKGFSYDADVEAAREQGLAEGRRQGMEAAKKRRTETKPLVRSTSGAAPQAGPTGTAGGRSNGRYLSGNRLHDEF